MGKKMALSFKDNSRDNNILDFVNTQRDKSNFIKDAIEFYISYLQGNLLTQNNRNVSNISIQKEEKQTNISTALSFMKLEEEEDL